MRAINDPGFKRIFCLIHADKLSYQVSDLALSSLSRLSQGEQGTYVFSLLFNVERRAIISRLPVGNCDKQ